jgi:hypothetical protein
VPSEDFEQIIQKIIEENEVERWCFSFFEKCLEIVKSRGHLPKSRALDRNTILR